MNQQNASQFLPLVQALAEGKTIQLINPLTGGWMVHQYVEVLE